LSDVTALFLEKVVERFVWMRCFVKNVFSIKSENAWMSNEIWRKKTSTPKFKVACSLFFMARSVGL